MTEQRATERAAKARKRPNAAPARRRGGEARAISELVPEIGRAAFRRFGFVQSSVVTRWREIVGDVYADVSVPRAIRFPRGERAGGTLELTVTGAFAPQLQAVTPEIIERVNRFFGYGAVARLKLVHGEVAPRETRERPARPTPALKPVSVEIGDSLRAIADPELGAVLEALSREVDARAEEAGEASGEADPFAGLPRIS
jgi:hypothetical protein